HRHSGRSRLAVRRGVPRPWPGARGDHGCGVRDRQRQPAADELPRPDCLDLVDHRQFISRDRAWHAWAGRAACIGLRALHGFVRGARGRAALVAAGEDGGMSIVAINRGNYLRRRIGSWIMALLCTLAAVLGIVLLALILETLLAKGAAGVSLAMFTQPMHAR